MQVKNGAPGAQTTQPAISYVRDAADRLTRISQAAGAINGNQAQTINVTYDADGRRTSMGGSLARTNLPAASVTDAVYDANNRLTQWAGKSCSYDANGNLIADGTHSYLWDERNQLKAISAGASQIASFQYDSQGRRSGKTIGASTTGYLY